MAEEEKKEAKAAKAPAKKAAPKKAAKPAVEKKAAAPKAKKATAKKAEAAPAKEEVKAAAPVKAEEAKAAPAKEEKKPELKEFKTHKPTIRNFEIILGPHITEETQRMQTKFNKMTFKVASDANAIEIKDAVQAIFNVKVDKVNVINVRPKEKRSTRYAGKVSGFKKAIVTINKEYDLGEIAKAAQAENAK
jgi:large subunit ribosomal protein L23